MKKSIKDAASAMAEAWPVLMSGTNIDFLTKNNITGGQLITLVSVYTLHKPTMGKLAENLHVSMPTVTGQINRLITQKLVIRSRSEKDRRIVYIELTAKGNNLIVGLQKIVRGKWEGLLVILTDKEVDIFQNIFKKLKNYIEKQKAKDEA